MTALIVYGPQGCGKTRNAEIIKSWFHRNRIVDEFDPEHSVEIQEFDLVLTQKLWPGAEKYWVMTFAEAMKRVTGSPERELNGTRSGRNPTT